MRKINGQFRGWYNVLAKVILKVMLIFVILIVKCTKNEISHIYVDVLHFFILDLLGLSKTELLLAADKEPKREIDRVRLIKEKGHQEPVTASITTIKTTLGHTATVEARDLSYQV